MKLSIPCVAACLLASAASAETAQKVTLAELARDPARFVDHRIRVDKLGCFQAEDGSYRCTTYKGAYLVPTEVVPAGLKTRIKDNCGGIVEAEDDPTCLFDVVFTPAGAEMGVGDVVENDNSHRGPVWMVKAGTITVSVHR